jgi:hypothetical protein
MKAQANHYVRRGACTRAATPPPRSTATSLPPSAATSSPSSARPTSRGSTSRLSTPIALLPLLVSVAVLALVTFTPARTPLALPKAAAAATASALTLGSVSPPGSDGPGVLVHNTCTPKEAADAAKRVTNAAKSLGREAQRGIRSLEKRIVEHEQKLAEFKANPTVRPGMEGQPKEIVEAAQQSRIRPLEKEIQTFRENIERLTRGDP